MKERKYYIDNLRWLCIFILVPYHAAMAWNSWGEGNYIYFYPDRIFSSFITLITPTYMTLLFVLAGMSARYSMEKRTTSGFVKERAKKLLFPLVVGMLTVVAAMAWLADKYHNQYQGSFFEHYGVFFTKFTTLTGYDGGWSPGHLWFLLYLFVIAAVCLFITALQKRFLPKLSFQNSKLPLILCLGVLPLAVSPIFNLGGKSSAAYCCFYLVGYYVFSEEGISWRIEKYRYVWLALWLLFDVADMVMFVWIPGADGLWNTVSYYVAAWFGILTLLSFSKRIFNQNNKVTRYLASRAFLFYIIHFFWLIVLQLWLSERTDSTAGIFIQAVLCVYVLTLASSEIHRLLSKYLSN